MKYFCGKCKRPTNHKELFLEHRSGQLDEHAFAWNDKYAIIECAGCDNISFLHNYGDSEMISQDEDGEGGYYTEDTIFPYYLEQGDMLRNLHLIPLKIRVIYEETLNALKSNSLILTAGGLRAIIESVCKDRGIESRNLDKRIDILANDGHISNGEAQRLHSIRFLGNDALHEIEVPNKGQIYILLDIVNSLISHLYINDKLLEGKVDTVIIDYSKFILLVERVIKEDMVDKTKTIKEILGKSIRRVKQRKLSDFETELMKEIESGEVDYLKIARKTAPRKYKIVKKPVIPFRW